MKIKVFCYALQLCADCRKFFHSHGVGTAACTGTETAVFIADVGDFHIGTGVQGLTSFRVLVFCHYTMISGKGEEAGVTPMNK